MISYLNLLLVLLIKLAVSAQEEDPYGELSSTDYFGLDYPNLFGYSPPVKLDKPSNFSYTSIEDFKNTFRVSFFARCPFEEFPLKCTCGKYKEMKLIRNFTEMTSTFVGVDPKTQSIVVAYRPAQPPVNFIRAYDNKLTHYPNTPPDVKVHRGFYQLLMSTNHKIQAYVKSLLEKKAYQDYSIKITGYSLGASLVSISIPNWMRFLSKNHYANPIAFYSYSGTRIGNYAYRDYLSLYNVPIMRHTHSDDVINLFPPRNEGFVHAGVEIYGARKRPDGVIPEWRICSQEYDKDPTCGLKKVTAQGYIDHLFPNSTSFPSPYNCKAG